MQSCAIDGCQINPQCSLIRWNLLLGWGICKTKWVFVPTHFQLLVDPTSQGLVVPLYSGYAFSMLAASQDLPSRCSALLGEWMKPQHVVWEQMGAVLTLWLQCIYFNFSNAFSHNFLIGTLLRHGLDKWTVRWIENWLNFWAQGVWIRTVKASWSSVTRDVPQGLIPESILLFITGLVNGGKCALNKFADSKKAGRSDWTIRWFCHDL